MKVYLVSAVQCYAYERMVKNFEVFKEKEEAMDRKQQLVNIWKHKFADQYDCLFDEVDDYITIEDYAYVCSLISHGGEEEIEIEVTELEIK